MSYRVREASASDVEAMRSLLPRLAAIDLPERRSPEDLWRGDEQVLLRWREGEEPDLVDLFGKLANVFADLDRRALKGTSYFKTIVSGDSIDAERKFKSTFSFTPYAKLIFSANEIPHSSDNTFAFYRRWCIIPFNNKFEGEKADVNLLHKLTTPEELSGLLNRALQGLIRLIDNNGFTEPRSVLNAAYYHRSRGGIRSNTQKPLKTLLVYNRSVV